VFRKVFALKAKANGAEGCNASVVELRVVPKEGSCSDAEDPRLGPGDADTINVEVRSVDPVLSVAVKVTINAPTSPDPGVPDNVLLALSSCSHLGGFCRVYSILAVVEVNVKDENTKLKGFATRATGGTCELMGKVMLGTPPTTVASINRTAAVTIASPIH